MPRLRGGGRIAGAGPFLRHCGSDVHGFDGSTGRRQPPLVMGHEAAGTVAGVARASPVSAEGDRVTFDSTVYCGACFSARAAKSPLRQPAGAGRLLRRLPPPRRVRRVRGGAGAHHVSLAGCAALEHAAMIERFRWPFTRWD